MISVRSIISFVIPSSILGLSWFWWRWKSKVCSIENENESVVSTDSDQDNLSCDTASNNLINVGGSEEIVSNKQNATVKEAEIKNNHSTCEEELPIDLHNTVEDLVLTQELPVFVSRENEMPNFLDTSIVRYNSNTECASEIEDEISFLFVNQEECEIPDFESVESGIVLRSERSDSAQLSVDCDDEGDIECRHFSPEPYDTSNFISGKRLRNRSSCGDSAIVDDYNSDTLSFTGSDSAVKSSEGEFSTPSKCKVADERSCDKGVYAQDNGRIHRDWYGSSLGSNNFKERPEKPRHWGSMPVTDSDSDSECILKRTAKIGSVSLDKLSIQLTEELSNVKLQRDRKFSSGKRHPRENRRRDRRRPPPADPSKMPKKPVTPKKPPTPKKNELSKKQRKKSSCCPKKDIDKPWRNETSSKRDDVSARREVVEYEFPDDMCGRLIGKSGRHISEFKESTGVDICIESELHGKNRVVSLTGLPNQIRKAEKLLNEKFHDSLKLSTFPDILDVVNNLSPVTLPEGSEVDVIVTAVIDVGSFYVQVFHCDVDEKLTQLQIDLSGIYISPRQKYIYVDKELPKVDEYCVSFVDNTWCRLKISEVDPEKRMVEASFIDYGGHVSLSIDRIWKIRPDLLLLPPQAVLCVLHNVIPLEGDEFSYSATDIFYQLIGGNVLKAFVVTTESDIPSIRLSYFSEERNEMVSISEQMHLWGLVNEISLIPFMESLDDHSIEFVDDFSEVDDTTSENSDNLKSILNSSAPQFICAS